MIIKVTPLIDTIGTEDYKTFLRTEFIVNDWGQLKLLDVDNNIDLKFNERDYIITFKNKDFKFPLPKTINDFINDMDRVGYQLYWNKWVYENLDPKDYLNKNDIYNHYKSLLETIEKSHELL